MVSIQIDEDTARAIEVQAHSAGLSVADYVRSLLPSQAATLRTSWEQIEQEIIALSSDEGYLPADFSRADIYDDHD